MVASGRGGGGVGTVAWVLLVLSLVVLTSVGLAAFFGSSSSTTLVPVAAVRSIDPGQNSALSNVFSKFEDRIGAGVAKALHEDRAETLRRMRELMSEDRRLWIQGMQQFLLKTRNDREGKSGSIAMPTREKTQGSSHVSSSLSSPSGEMTTQLKHLVAILEDAIKKGFGTP